PSRGRSAPGRRAGPLAAGGAGVRRRRPGRAPEDERRVRRGGLRRGAPGVGGHPPRTRRARRRPRIRLPRASLRAVASGPVRRERDRRAGHGLDGRGSCPPWAPSGCQLVRELPRLAGERADLQQRERAQQDRLRATVTRLGVVDLPWLTRFDLEWLAEAVAPHADVFVLEDPAPVGGLGDALRRELSDAGLIDGRSLTVFGVDGWPACGTPPEVL